MSLWLYQPIQELEFLQWLVKMLGSLGTRNKIVAALKKGGLRKKNRIVTFDLVPVPFEKSRQNGVRTAAKIQPFGRGRT
jgi:hypothetical protein